MAELDQLLWSLLETAAGCQIRRVGHMQGGRDILTFPVIGLEGKPFAEWVVRQPV